MADPMSLSSLFSIQIAEDHVTFDSADYSGTLTMVAILAKLLQSQRRQRIDLRRAVRGYVRA